MSWASTSRYGMLVNFGNASGPPAPLDIRMQRQGLSQATRAGLVHSYALKDAAQAHRDLEARRTTGAVVPLM